MSNHQNHSESDTNFGAKTLIAGTAKEQRDGLVWMASAGVLAALLAVSIFAIDNWLTSNYKAWDHAHEMKIREVRVAQTSLPSGVSDTRQNQEDR